jgi:hypothetical protein
MTSYANVHKTAFTEMSKSICTSVPGHVLAFDPILQRVQVQIGIIRVDVNGAMFNPPPIIDTPVHFVGDGYVIECQIDVGCEGIILFSQRCMDGWKNTGGIADNPIGRFHDMQDAIFIPGIRSQGNVVSDFSNNGLKLRNKEGSQVAWLKNDGSIDIRNGAGFITLGADGVVNINGVTFDTESNIKTPTQINAQQSLIVADKEMKEHRHGGVQTGSGNTGAPI